MRAFALAGLASVLAFLTVAPQDAAGPAPAAVAPAEPPVKATQRLPDWPTLRPRLAQAPAAPVPGEGAIGTSRLDPSRPWSLFAAAATLPEAGRFTPEDEDITTASLSTDAFAPQPTRGWQEGAFTRVAALDGRTFASEGKRIRLAGLELPAPGALCRTLDGRREPCAIRAATQLELITRARTLTCRYRMEGAADAVGECRIGDSDLAERLLRTGYVKRSGGGAPAVVAAGLRPSGA